MSAPAERKETSFWEEMRGNQEFHIWLNGEQGSGYYEKWLQYQMLRTMRGLKGYILTIPIISTFSDF